ncbi:MAG: ATP-binding cassette domain-containing protein [Firmicutes bacterium]|nr:ATP-binding cassette domain-containing protein [Bacillota bacterium]
MEQLVKVQCLKHIYPDQTQVDLCGLDFVVPRGKRVVVLGGNGAGKTTLLFHVLGFLSPVEGRVEVDGRRPDKHFKETRKIMGVVFQNVEEQIIGPSVFDDIAFTLRNEGRPEQEIKERVKWVASALKINNLLDKIPHYLSGGQKKKVALAGAVVHRPQLLVLDEPFESLDPQAKEEIILFLNRLNLKNKTTLLIATHEIDAVPEIADLVYIINRGRILAKGSPQEVFARVDDLLQAGLKPPVLTELFARLRRQGIGVKIPQSMEEAERQLIRLLSDPKS